MAEISSANVFTNGNSGSGDLLQQAFQQVVDESDQENEFVAFLQNDSGDTPVIQLTAQQAAALGITIKIDDQPVEDNTTDFQNCRESEQSEQQSFSQEDSQQIINELTQSGLLKHNGVSACSTFDNWTGQQEQSGHGENYQQESNENSLTLETIENFTQERQNIITEQTNNIVHVQANHTESILSEQEVQKNIENQCNENLIQNTIQFNISDNSCINNNVVESQAQILQRFPVILPSSQFIIKPTQTVLTPVKNLRILPNTTKASNSVQTSQNSVRLSKTSIINTISPHLVKTMPVGTQFLSTSNNLSRQLLNTSQLFTKSCDSSNKIINESLCAMSNNVPALSQNLIHQSAAKSLSKQIQQKGNLQQFFTPILKTNSNSQSSVKSTSLLNNNTVKQNTITSTLKSIQFPTQLLKTTYVKSPVASLTLSKNNSTPVIFRTTPVIKPEEIKSPILSPKIRTQAATTPVSILKPQAKTTNSILSKLNCTNTFLSSKSSSKQIELSNTVKPLVTAKLKPNMNSIMKSIKKKTIPQKLTTIKQESTDLNKPLGSSENPIQIVQQGHTFHSMQRLTQAQLKQIAQVLHQRSQESSNPNEKVIYRLVFPDEMDLRMKSPSSLLKNRGGKRGRPKKNAIKPPILANKPIPEEDLDDGKDERKKIARTRSGRLSRPPRHMVRDYKHLHHLDFMQPDLDDSDGGYSDYNTGGSGANGNKQEEEDGIQRTELLTGLEVPKRKISDHFRCPTCSKIYLGRTRMARHFEMHPDHGSPDQLPPPTVETELKQTPPQDPLKRKGKKRGPWAYVTPEAKSERRQMKLQEAISVCEGTEIAKIAGKPVANSVSLFDLLVLKSENNVRTFLAEIRELIERVREKTGTMLSVANNEEKLNEDVVDLNEELLCDVLALNSGFYKVNEALNIEELDVEERHSNENFEMESNTEPPLKMAKTETLLEEGKENIEERLSSGFSESSDISVSDFLNERKADSTSVNCPEVLSALTLMPRNNPTSPVNDISKVLSSGAEVQTTDNSGFQKLNINVTSISNSSFMNEATFTKLGENLDSSCTDVFTKLNGNYDQTKVDNLPRAFIKLEPTEEGFIKLENGMFGSFRQDIEGFGKIQTNGFHYVSNGASDSFNNKGFRKLISKTSTTIVSNDEELKVVNSNGVPQINENSVQITTSSSNNNTDSSMCFETSNNLDITKITGYDIGHLDILDNTGVMDKNLMIDDKFVEHMELTDNSNMVDEIVCERLKTMMPDNLLESNLLHGNGNLDTELDFEEFSEEFNKNTRS